MNNYYGESGCCLTCDKDMKGPGCLCYDCNCKKCDEYVSNEDGTGYCNIAKKSKIKSQVYNLKREWEDDRKAIYKMPGDPRPMTDHQRTKIEKLIEKKEISGTKEGMNLLDRGEANKLILLHDLSVSYEDEIGELEDCQYAPNTTRNEYDQGSS